jgi:hypothetical protein
MKLYYYFSILTNDDYTTLKQLYEYEQCYRPTEREIKKILLLFDLHSYLYDSLFLKRSVRPSFKVGYILDINGQKLNSPAKFQGGPPPPIIKFNFGSV